MTAGSAPQQRKRFSEGFCLASWVLRVCSSDPILLIPGVRRLIVHSVRHSGLNGILRGTAFLVAGTAMLLGMPATSSVARKDPDFKAPRTSASRCTAFAGPRHSYEVYLRDGACECATPPGDPGQIASSLRNARQPRRVVDAAGTGMATNSA